MIPVFFVKESTLSVFILNENTDTELEVAGTVLKDQARRVVAPFAHTVDVQTEFLDFVGAFTGIPFASSDAGTPVGFVRRTGAVSITNVGEMIMERSSFVVPWTFTVETVTSEPRIVKYFLKVDQPITGFSPTTITFEGLTDNPTMVDGDGKLNRAVEDTALPGTTGEDFTVANNDGIISALVGENQIDQGLNFAAPVSIFKKNLYQT
jgi:hypothetical protein